MLKYFGAVFLKLFGDMTPSAAIFLPIPHGKNWPKILSFSRNLLSVRKCLQKWNWIHLNGFNKLLEKYRCNVDFGRMFLRMIKDLQKTRRKKFKSIIRDSGKAYWTGKNCDKLKEPVQDICCWYLFRRGQTNFVNKTKITNKLNHGNYLV
jgi:hypothetical protein